ncbi:hypothetical protein [Gordonia sihwensis]|uniref:hypothetical protein n=1 Tax=Gordonia sihwensis TaxID=173559 RepID=UPI003D967446
MITTTTSSTTASVSAMPVLSVRHDETEARTTPLGSAVDLDRLRQDLTRIRLGSVLDEDLQCLLSRDLPDLIYEVERAREHLPAALTTQRQIIDQGLRASSAAEVHRQRAERAESALTTVRRSCLRGAPDPSALVEVIDAAFSEGKAACLLEAGR